MKRHFQKIRNHYHRHKETLSRLWDESPLTRSISIGSVGIGVIAVGMFVWNAYESKQIPQKSIDSITVSQEDFEDLHLSSTNSNAQTLSASSKKEPSISAPSAKNTPVYGVENTLQLERDLQVTLKQEHASKAVESIISSTNRLDPIYTDSTDLLTKHIDVLRILKSYLSINLISLMNGSPNREQVLDSLFVKLQNAQTTIQTNINELNSEIARLKDEYSRHESVKKTASANFTAKLGNFDANGTSAELKSIIEEEQKAAEFYSRYRSFEKIRDIYVALQKPIATKLTVISANREALIKGVRVVAIPGMQEDLVLTESQWRELVSK